MLDTPAATATVHVAGISYPLALPPDGSAVDAKPADDVTEEEEELLVTCGRLWIRRRFPADRTHANGGEQPAFVMVDASSLLGRAAAALASD